MLSPCWGYSLLWTARTRDRTTICGNITTLLIAILFYSMDLIYLSCGSSNADSSKSSFDMDGSVPHEQVSAVVVSKADPLAERRRAKALKVHHTHISSHRLLLLWVLSTELLLSTSYSCWMRRWLNCHKNQRAGTTWYVLLLYLLLPLYLP